MLVGCRKPDWQIVPLPSSPDGQFRAEARVLSEGAELYVTKHGQAWSEYAWMALGQCSNAEFYWADKFTAILAYDKAEIVYFVDNPEHWAGAHVRICNRSTTACPPPVTEVKKIPGCDDHSM